jgi:formamidopyrimidine-DNA glycosylase
MPELPEVETIVRGLRSRILAQPIAKARLLRRDLLKNAGGKPKRFADFFEGKSFRSVERHGKFILFELNTGDKLLAHLGMTGKFVVCTEKEPLPDHLCSQILFADQFRLDHVDVRRFGRLELYAQFEEIPVLKRIGPDPLTAGFGPRMLQAIIVNRDGRGKRRRALHTLLLDQSLISGVGNIYAAEALFRAGIRPQRRADRITSKELERLAQALQQVLLASLEAGGTTVNDFRRVDDKPGEFRSLLQVYDREGEPCKLCRSSIRRLRIQGRSAYFCPQCQK